MKLLLYALAALSLAACDRSEQTETRLDPVPLLTRENAELKKKVARLEKEKEEMAAEIELRLTPQEREHRKLKEEMRASGERSLKSLSDLEAEMKKKRESQSKGSTMEPN